MALVKFCLFLFLATVYAAPSDPALLKWSSPDLRYTYLEDDQGNAHLVDNWLKMTDLQRMARYTPDQSNVYHLFTRSNPSISQPLVLSNVQTVHNSNFDGRKRTIVLMHGFLGSATSAFNSVLVPAFLAAGDLNVIVLDWSAGSLWGLNAIQAGGAAGRFINWLNSITGSTANLYQTVGYSVGGHGAGVIARHVVGNVQSVIGLDPVEANRWDPTELLSPNDGLYTEAIHTSSLGEQSPLAQVDFYPNGGLNMPGCLTPYCDHYRSYYYYGESLISGGFTGRQCTDLAQALTQNCTGPNTLQLGGLNPKTGRTGIYHLRTNRSSPFSQG